jgi:type I restriction enzyme S subunit
VSTNNGWQRAKFVDFADNVAVRVDDPSQARVERYVGLEHLDANSLEITRWGSPSDVEATKLRFWPGDIIFGRRRAYQRKVAVAQFEGICSAHALVLRAKADVVLPEFLPFFMQSETFFQRALAISVGSLSPTINWKTLREQEFDLPPIDEQRETAALLEAADRASRTAAAQLRALSEAKRALFDHRVELLEGPITLFREVWSRSPESGCSAPPVDEDTGHFVLSLAALTLKGYRLGQLKAVKPSTKMISARLSKGDLLVSRSNTIEMVGFTALFPEDRSDISFPDTMMRISVDASRVLPEYVEAVLMSRDGRRHIRSVAAGTSASMKKINREGLGSLRMVVPSLDVQRDLVGELAELEVCEELADQQHERARLLFTQLREELVSA